MPDAAVGAARASGPRSRGRVGEALRRDPARVPLGQPRIRSRPGSERAEVLVGAAARVTERRFDALRFVGPGTDLTVGLLPTSRFLAARFETVDGITHCRTSRRRRSSPRRTRCAPTASCARPSRWCSAARSSAGWRSSSARAAPCASTPSEDAEVLRSYAARDEDANRLGEIALVDGEGRIGAAGHRLLRHAARRERGEPHRARPRLRDVAWRSRRREGQRLDRSTSTS